MLHLKLFSVFLLDSDGRVIALPTRKAEALVAYLALARPARHTREKLASLLWNASGTDQARQSLRQTLFTIRKLFPDPDVISTDADRIALAPDAIETDVAEFERLASKDDRESLQSAAALYTGELLQDLTIDEERFDAWLHGERQRLREIALSVVNRLIDGVPERVLDNAIQLALTIIAADPLHESAHRALMSAYARQGHRDLAIRQYYTCADLLRKRLSVEPSAETKQIFKRILADQAPAVPENESMRETEHINVLVVEDNTLSRELLRAILTPPRFRVSTAADGAQALIALGRERFQVVLLDLNLPNVDGFTILRAIQQNDFTMPVIVITDHHDPAREVKALDEGAADFLRKPIQKDILIKRIEKVLRERNMTSTMQ